jgi:hypothetical protein
MNKDLKTLYYVHAIMPFLIICVIWGLALSNSPHLDGVSIYSLSSSLPISDVSNAFPASRHGNRSASAFLTEAGMMPYCVFPRVYNKLTDRPNQAISSYLTAEQMASTEDAAAIFTAWNKINFDTWDNPFRTTGDVQYNMPYNLPYDGLEEGKSLNPQYFSPVCRCLNSVLELYSQGKGTYDSTVESLKACMATRHIIRQQKLVGDDSLSNSDLTTRKYISRHALLFSLCTASAFSMIYNMIDFNKPGSTFQFFMDQLSRFLPLFFAFCFAYLAQIFSFAAVSPANSMQFSSIVYMPAALIFIVVELLWSHVAKKEDTRRQTYLHPYSFYVILVNLYTIALIENGVFTLEVMLTFVFLSNTIALAYTATLFTAHGKLWQQDAGGLTGYILILCLVFLSCIFHCIPIHPINSELNYLWILPFVFAFFCFAQIVVLEHLMGEDTEVDESDPGMAKSIANSSTFTYKKFRFTSSVHLLNMGHTAIISLVILYYAAQMHYTWYGDMSFTQTGGKLDRRLNFELAELLEAPSYNNPVGSQGGYLRST